MAKWRIAWTQVVGDAGELHHVDEVEESYAAAALTQWQWRRGGDCDAEVLAVWRVGCEKVLQDAIGDGGADNRTPGGEA